VCGCGCFVAEEEPDEEEEDVEALVFVENVRTIGLWDLNIDLSIISLP